MTIKKRLVGGNPHNTQWHPLQLQRKVKSAQTHNNDRFKSYYHEDRFNKYIKHKEVLAESKILIDVDELSLISEQINQRKWQKLIDPPQVVGYTMMREFYANAWVTESEKHLPLTYTSFIRRKDISFTLEVIHKVLSLRNSPLNNVASYHDRKNANDLRPDDILRDLCIPGARWVTYDNGKPHFLRRTDLQNMARGWSEVNTERAMLVHSIIIGEDIQVDEIIANQIYKFTKKTDRRAKLPFPGIVKCLCNRAKASAPDDTLIPVEGPIDGKMMMRVRGT
ncbi:hypothetical protein PIB30_065444 [Stylosanthes scabra]|uniref:Putative plant transposon protein domain-containing protein n=1 Tax=Stylosanthes scabra TaxID=79078 RepID=A0ABU6VL26_9FABA|nr:hypothetical protein [Stylosanthes scabra]